MAREAGSSLLFAGVMTENLFLGFPLTLDFESWTAPASTLVLACLAGLLAYAVRTSLRARPVA
jgi:hypothetical protein